MGNIVTLTGPSGAGKTTLAGALFNFYLCLYPNAFRLLISQTTRPPRTEGSRKDLPGEYNCISKAEFERILAEDKFLWHIFVHGNWYGTMRQSVDEAMRAAYVSIAVLTIEAVETLWQYTGGKITPIFIQRPEPLIEESLRGKESPEFIAKRMVECRGWFQRAKNSVVPFRYIQNDGTVPELVHNFFEQYQK
ncbi:MAG: hypothetical protein A2750_03450 [Candidatus Yanofskybacteria bacterium RIFCSPHIGHO2_01_FULL_45_42]|uniref:Guanylate kinase-like domain-containing protein n=3 Tax=Candidatus Yanofskyibacteriota TaxID=1752733 RepID=A0A1F8H3C4_9BACT|nr:MAG: hypothetical protein A2750_03450 [Candidatus Yanofskybacteria bacterium RIFCSPHIGHO2_01_FULL_45_42]OGN16126.1 MAG: hypothetical protein A3C81_00940 [Candidatus Yanofskybacteria bacterium RIFCSPHIGHO2_02_FULL_46_19]OGN26254.1 MAG: hypothetical protein A3B17_02720 [Candidatus Yanofskybacteria bacterium RIFCSPLOWO2_01_FULL_45_72]OGN31780.1 MAG: hypothetical protein A3J01_03255 [Candidatus Yanofskybacteria bacterium RIFCSPLOWO2_02_FULL_45_18]